MRASIGRTAIRTVAQLLAPEGRRLRDALRQPARAQRTLLVELARSCARTGYGRRLEIRDAEDFLARAPVVDYEDIEPWIQSQSESAAPLLCEQPPLAYEKTSGSSGRAKLIPLTAGLRRSFTRMFAAWVHDLISAGPAFQRGLLYMAISPSFGPAVTTGSGAAIGLEDDAEYVDGLTGRLLRSFLAVPAGVSRERDPARFKRRVMRQLIAAEGLEVISVWSPSFLTVLLEAFEADKDAVLREAGPSLGARRRALALREPTPWPLIWPQLKLISCWDAGSARPLADGLRRRFPGVLVQGKGLLATEAPITIPLLRAPGPVPLLNEVLIEFEDAAGRLCPFLEGRIGEVYGLVISQRGGLTRYRLGDRVRLGPSWLGCPTLDFLGRGDSVVDLVGEKLSEEFVAAALTGLDLGGAELATLVPLREPSDHYELLLDRSSRDLSALAQELDATLREAHHYGHARALGQLPEASLRVERRGAERLALLGEEQGLRWGDQKPRALWPRPAARLPELG